MADESKERIAGYVAALLEERRAYLARGDQDGVEQVDAELKRVGAKGEPPAKRATKREAKPDTA